MTAQHGSGAQIIERGQLVGAELTRVRSAAAAATAADGVAPVGDGPLRYLAGGDGARHLMATAADGRVIGYANVQSPGTDGASAELLVVPSARRRGVGGRLLAAAIASGGPAVRVWAHGDLPAARALAASAGMVRRRTLLQLRRGPEAGPLPATVVPDGVELRTYTDADAAEVLRVNAAAFSWHPEQGALDEADFAAQRAESWFDPAGLFLAVPADDPATVLGFHWTKVHPATDTEPALGEVYVVGVDPVAQGRSLGSVLTLAGLHHLAGAGLDTVLLYVEGDNIPALKTYERLGFTRFRADIAYGLS